MRKKRKKLTFGQKLIAAVTEALNAPGTGTVLNPKPVAKPHQQNPPLPKK
jgi:hypothetical protein